MVRKGRSNVIRTIADWGAVGVTAWRLADFGWLALLVFAVGIVVPFGALYYRTLTMSDDELERWP